MDRLSSLSDDVLAHILSFLNIKSAVQTSVLASRWKYLHQFATSLDVSHLRIKLSSYRNAVSRVLMQHKVNIKKFTLWLPYDCGDVDGSVVKSWIAVAVSRGVEEFNFCIHGKYDWDLGSLFISLTLVVFNLRGCGTGTFPRIPSSVWLPNLKILHMTEIRLLDSSSMTRLFDGCPLLEDLSLDSCVWEDGQVYTITAPMLRYLNITTCEDMNIYLDTEPKVEFDVPRLKCFEFVGPVRELYCIKNSSALAIAKVVDCSWWDDIFSLVRGLSDATTMKLVQKYYQDSDDKYCSRCFLPDRLPIFGNLLELEVSLGPRNSLSVLTRMLQHLISKSPKLETLVFREGFRFCYSHLWEHIHEWDPFIWSSQIKVIQVNNFFGSTEEAEMVTFFLTKVKGLKQLNVNVAVAEHRESNDYCYMNVASDLSDEYYEYCD